MCVIMSVCEQWFIYICCYVVMKFNYLKSLERRKEEGKIANCRGEAQVLLTQIRIKLNYLLSWKLLWNQNRCLFCFVVVVVFVVVVFLFCFLFVCCCFFFLFFFFLLLFLFCFCFLLLFFFCCCFFFVVFFFCFFVVVVFGLVLLLVN